VIRDPIDKIKSTLAVRWDRAKTGNVNWGNQFKDAIFNVYGDDDDEAEEAPSLQMMDLFIVVVNSSTQSTTCRGHSGD
ncbi:unnamed protein product, partial [Symbiodinium pilosum]